MNNNRYLENLIVTNTQSVAISIATMKVLLGIQEADIHFDSLLTEYLKYGISRVENRTEVFLSRREVEIPFENWSGDLLLIGGGVMTGLSVKDLLGNDIEFKKVESFKLNIDSKNYFVIKYTAGLETPKEDMKQAVLAIVDIKFHVKEIDEQEHKIERVLRTLRNYINANRWL